MEGSGRKAPYYMHRGVPSTQLEWQGPPGFRPTTNLTPPPIQVNASGGFTPPPIQVNARGDLTPPPIQVNASGGGGGSGGTVESEYVVETSAMVVHSGGEAGMSTGEFVKRKRGRPRKYGPEVDVLSPLSSSDATGEKRGRGRPPGTGRKQLLASLGELIAGTAGTGFTPHVVIIKVGEDIAARVMAFSQQGPRSVSILSATGAVSTLTVRHSSNSGGSVTYEGRFEILHLSGSYTLSDDGVGHRRRTGCLSISVSNSEGNVIGGEVSGELIAATPVQIVVGSFLSERSKKKNKATPNTETKPATDPPAEDDIATSDKSATPTAPPSGQALTPPMTNAWPRHVDMRKPVDLTDG